MKTVLAPPAVGYRGPTRWPLSVEAYHALGQMGLIPEKTELLHGFVYHKMPKSPLHRLLVLRLLQLLQARLAAGIFVQSEQPLTLADSEPEPDISLIRGSVEDFPANHPTTAELVVEICVTSHDYDREKLAAYAAAGVKEVWLVLGPEKQVEVFWQPIGNGYANSTVLNADATLTSVALPSVSVRLAELFRS
ncbi:MAG TPA: Uma2 family endonuclease [Verrucomicrobiota bacterium]|nr:Uma2 family endonuclease [Verrucomicrobiales bacterium]HRI11841.1 Uma2 family endonuclease [Verrucomicrobiota bacterium]